MKNTLPAFKSFSVDLDSSKSKKFTSWIPEKSLIVSNNTLKDLSNDISKEESIPERKKVEEKKALMPSLPLYHSDESPLCLMQRGIADDPQIAMPKENLVKSHKQSKRLSELQNGIKLNLGVVILNMNNSGLDIYIQREGTVFNNLILPDCKFKW